MRSTITLKVEHCNCRLYCSNLIVTFSVQKSAINLIQSQVEITWNYATSISRHQNLKNFCKITNFPSNKLLRKIQNCYFSILYVYHLSRYSFFFVFDNLLEISKTEQMITFVELKQKAKK